MSKLIQIVMTYHNFFTGTITFEEFNIFFRRRDIIIIQYLYLQLFLLIGGLLISIPIYMIIGASMVLIYGVFLQSKAKTLKQILLHSAVWAISSFVILAIILIISVELFGFMK